MWQSYTVFPQIIALQKGDRISNFQSCMTAEEIHEHTAKKKKKSQQINPVNGAVRFTKKQQAIKTIDRLSNSFPLCLAMYLTHKIWCLSREDVEDSSTKFILKYTDNCHFIIKRIICTFHINATRNVCTEIHNHPIL